MRDLEVAVTASGTLEPSTSVEVAPEISGKVRAVRADFNDQVKHGQILAELDTDYLRGQLEQAESQVALAKAHQEEANVTRRESHEILTRTRGLVKNELAADEELEAAAAMASRADAALAASAAQLRAAQAGWALAKTNLARATIRSPIDGVVLARSVEVGQTVVAALQASVLFRLAEDLRQMRLVVDVDEADIGRVKPQQKASFTVAAWPGKIFPATVASVRNAPQTQENVVTYEAVLDVDNTEGMLRPGMTGTVQIVAESERQAVAVPNAALRFRPSSQDSKETASAARVWLLVQGKPVETLVQTGVSDGEFTAIHNQIRVGAEVIVAESPKLAVHG